MNSILCRRWSRCSRAAQQGATLVELMVGIAIGLLVVLAAVGSLVFTQATSTVVGDSSRLQQTADNVFRNMGFHLTQAGAINVAPADPAEPALLRFSTDYTGFNPVATGAAAGQIFSVHGVEGTSNAPDTLRVSYQDNMLSTDTVADQNRWGVRDCIGNRPSTTVRVDNEFYVANGELMCLGASAAAAQSIASGVEDFQVSYGVKTIVAGAPQFRFYAASSVPDWQNVQSVRVCLQLAGDTMGNPQPGFSLTGCRGQSISSDGRLRRVFWRTFSIRNALT